MTTAKISIGSLLVILSLIAFGCQKEGSLGEGNLGNDFDSVDVGTGSDGASDTSSGVDTAGSGDTTGGADTTGSGDTTGGADTATEEDVATDDVGDDLCPEDPNKTEPGECGCGVPEGTCGGVPASNLQVKLSGVWKGVCCNSGELEISSADCDWEEHGRVLDTSDVGSGKYTELRCPENNQNPADCDCHVPGERMHGIKADGNVAVSNSLRLPEGGPIFPNSGHETCIDLVNGELQSRWTTDTCPRWRLLDFY